MTVSQTMCKLQSLQNVYCSQKLITEKDKGANNKSDHAVHDSIKNTFTDDLKVPKVTRIDPPNRQCLFKPSRYDTSKIQFLQYIIKLMVSRPKSLI